MQKKDILIRLYEGDHMSNNMKAILVFIGALAVIVAAGLIERWL